MPSLAGWEGGVLMKGGKVQGELWKTIRRGWIEFQARTKFEVRGDAWMVQFWDEVGGVGHWSPCFFRNVQDWEVDMVEDFLKKI
ncbi:hypothetical protein CK203_070800 [Vitis vinifera]|uniref:Uncharacterized protein n=1 Tax=Vitis vinifera TaxID=29760 RepID=A0A438E3W9_VITVI|nr:hypothetical protein CK203_070800 [Vitis vinifera]